MSKKSKGGLSSWAQLRFSIIGGLLARPPERGYLLRELEILAGRSYQHPTGDVQVTFGTSTIERWYYRALESNDPVQALKRKIRSDAGTTRVMSSELLNALAKQYKNYPGWSYRLHADNVAALVNCKQESFWGQLEGRLLAMVSRDESLTMDFLNLATQAWAEMEYNRSPHEEISSSPIERLLQGPDVSRPSPDSEKLRFAFTVHEIRSQRQSDGTLQIKGVRFEVPSRFRHFKRLHVRYQSWDLSTAWLVDERTGDLLARIYPWDKSKNAHGKRRTLSPLPEDAHLPDKTDSDPYPPLLRKLLAEYAATGLPPAYIPKCDPTKNSGEADNE